MKIFLGLLASILLHSTSLPTSLLCGGDFIAKMFSYKWPNVLSGEKCEIQGQYDYSLHSYHYHHHHVDCKPLLRYMGNMYTLDAFNTSNPADQDILSHYKMQQVIRAKLI